MKNYLINLIIILVFISSIQCFSQTKNEIFEIASKEVVGETYSIEVVLPAAYDSIKKYPIVYHTDWWFASQLTTSISNRVLKYNIEPVIIVGIQRKNTNTTKDYYINRTKEFTPTNVPESDKASGFPTGTSGGAKHFLSFIKNELIPAVEKKYLSDTENRGYIGYSFGGLFGTYILLNEPQLFNKYLIGSPSLWWDDYLLAKELKEMKAENLISIKSIFLAVEEEGTQLQSYSRFREQLIKKKPDSLQLESVIILGEDHMTAVPSTILKGLKFLYGK